MIHVELELYCGGRTYDAFLLLLLTIDIILA